MFSGNAALHAYLLLYQRKSAIVFVRLRLLNCTVVPYRALLLRFFRGFFHIHTDNVHINCFNAKPRHILYGSLNVFLHLPRRKAGVRVRTELFYDLFRALFVKLQTRNLPTFSDKKRSAGTMRPRPKPRKTQGTDSDHISAAAPPLYESRNFRQACIRFSDTG